MTRNNEGLSMPADRFPCRARVRAGLSALALILSAASAFAQAKAAPAERLLPERFLREYDPVTVFFAQDRGPRGGGPGDDASGLLSISPAHPGEYRWLDSKTLQFLPAEPWPALRTFVFKTPGEAFTRSTLLSPPVQVTPAHGARNLASLQDITLGFAAPIPLETLADMIGLEVRPLPGLSSQSPTFLGRRDFEIKELDRKDRKSPARYSVRLSSPIGDGKAILLRLRLSLDEGIPGSAAVYEYATRTDFRVLSFGSGSTSYPVSSSGSAYPADQAISCGTGTAPLFVQFTEALDPATPVAALKAFASFEPAVRNLRFEVSGQKLLIHFDRDPDTDYRLELRHGPLSSASGRELSAFASSSLHFFYKSLAPYVQWGAGQAILERYGPQSLPMEARGIGKVDLRVYAIDPLDLGFWPFPDSVVTVAEDKAPPMPGEEPAYGADLAKQLRLLGSPDFSEVVELPSKEKGGAASFGVDLLPAMKRIGREGKSGSYLVGYRSLGSDTARTYMRIQVTDLCLTVVEESRGIVFAVTSLSTGKPIEGAALSLDSIYRKDDGSAAARALVSGKTDRSGEFVYVHAKPLDAEVSRIVVSAPGDSLVIDTAQAPPYFHENHWYGPQSRWLGWLTMKPQEEDLAAKHLAYLFSERPIYRAEEAVHIQGFVRAREKGLIVKDDLAAKRTLVVSCPDGKEFRYKVEAKGSGYFYQLFDEKELPTGSYNVTLLDSLEAPLAAMSFQKEAYRVPSFEIQLNGPDRVSFDDSFRIQLDASYYAGGKVVGQSVEWSVAEGAWPVSPASWPDYSFSTYLSVGGEYRDEGVSASESEDVTDEDGSASLTIDPRTAQSVQSRYYRIQASVRGADAQTVSRSKTVLALPPFSIGLKLPRFETSSMAVKGSIVVLDHLEKVLEGKELTLRLYERQWHSYLSESDITTGDAKYVSDVVDELVLERKVVSGKDALPVELPVANAGVYIVEVQGRDSVGRLQSVKRDLYVSGPTPVAWKRTTAAVFETSLDKKRYEPGDTARVLIQSPFQSAMAFVVVERPSGNLYRWVEVKNAQGMIDIAVTENLVPRFPVHVVLMRGRLPGSPAFEAGQDRLKPLSVANTTWITVDPSSNRVEVQLLHEAKAAPGTEFRIDLTMVDRDGKAVDGSVALWLVDRAVLALAKERFASPLSAFITDAKAAVRISDTRNLGVGNLPFEELAGGDWAEASLFGDLLDKDTVRKNFKTVPYFNPAVQVKNGKGSVTFTLPDNLTEFAVRAIATSGADKFGVAKSTVMIRLPVTAQEALPRFVRPGDEVVAGGMARVVEGPGGAAQAELELGGGLVLSSGEAKAKLKFDLDPKLPSRLYFPLKAPLSLAGDEDAKVSVSLGAGRLSDGAKDAFMIELPVRRDTIVKRLETSASPKPGEAIDYPWPREEVRKGSTAQTLYVTAMPELIQVLRSLRFQAIYPYGCTEQRIAKAHARIAMRAALGAAGLPDDMLVSNSYMSYLLNYLQSVIGEDGLYAFYPGERGTVYLTAYVVEFLVDAKTAGYAVPDALMERPMRALKEALRSDYGRLTRGYSSLERSMALCALDAAGYYDPSYGQDLLALAQEADAYTQARIWLALSGKKGLSGSQVDRLRDKLLKQVVFQKRGAELVVAGLQEKRSWFGNPFLYSDYRTMAAIYSVYAKDKPKAAETKAILSYLLAQAGERGWGDTYTNTCVLKSLAEAVKGGSRGSGAAELWDGKAWVPVDLKGKAIAKATIRSDVPLKARLKGSGAKGLTLLLETSYVPALPGSNLAPVNEGFSVTRELLDYGAGKELGRRMEAMAGVSMLIDSGSVVEDHARVYNPQDRAFVAVRMPLAAGFEPLNPNLATAPAEAAPAGRITLKPAYADYEDDQVTFYYDSLPAGTYDFYYRARVNFEGRFSLPPVVAQGLYDLGVQGSSAGAPVVAEKAEGSK
jgi:alpha-2-macroglobulin